MEMSIWVPVISVMGGAIIGALIGFFFTLKVEQHKREQLKKDFKESLCTELREAMPRAVNLYFVLNKALGGVNRDMLNWIHSMSSVADGEPWEFAKRIEDLLKLSDDRLATLSLQAKDPEGTGSLIKKFNLSFTRENIFSFALLEPHFRRSILDIRTEIGCLNEEIELYNFFYEKTFASGLTQENREVLEINRKKSYETIAQVSCEIAEMIKKLIG